MLCPRLNFIHTNAPFQFTALTVKPSTQFLKNRYIWDTIHELLINHIHLNLLSQVKGSVMHDLSSVCLLLEKLMMCAKTWKHYEKLRHTASVISAARNCSYLQVVFPVDNESVAEHVPHDDQVRVLTLHRNTVHAQKLRKKCTAMTLHYMLRDTTQNIMNYISWALPIMFMIKMFMQ